MQHTQIIARGQQTDGRVSNPAAFSRSPVVEPIVLCFRFLWRTSVTIACYMRPSASDPQIYGRFGQFVLI
jgi:hypothetical protein